MARSTLTLDHLSKLMDMFEEQARLGFQENGAIKCGSAIGATLFPDGSRGLGILSVTWEDVSEDKREVQAVLEKFVEVSEAEWIINITECWAALAQPGEDPDDPNWKRPAERSDRFEMIMLHGECASGVVQRSILIDRKDGEAFLSSTRESRMGPSEASAVADSALFGRYFIKPPTITA